MKGLAKLLRHTKLECMDDEGWVPLSYVATILHVSEEDIIKEVGDKSKKKRFEVSEPLHNKIRARYGHSITLSTPPWKQFPVYIDANSLYNVMHTTTEANWGVIQKDGYLRPMNRMTIHFATDYSLLRKHPIVLHLDMERAVEHGISLYWATDNIIVCPAPIHVSFIHQRCEVKNNIP